MTEHRNVGTTGTLVATPALGTMTFGAEIDPADLRLTADERATLDAASSPLAADYPYGAPGVAQRSRG